MCIFYRAETEKGKSRSTIVNMYAKHVEEYVLVDLSETPTISIFSLPSLITATEGKEIAYVQERNAKYAQVIESHKNPDGFAPRFTQTVNNPQKNQNEMTVSNTLKESGCQVTSFDIIDANSQLNESDFSEAEILGTIIQVCFKQQPMIHSTLLTGGASDNPVNRAGLTAKVKKFVDTTISVSLAAPGCLLDPSIIETADTAEVSGGTKKGKSTKASATVGTGTSTAMVGAAAGNSDSGVDAANQGLSGTGLAGPPSQSGIGIGGGPSQSGANISGGVSGWGAEGSNGQQEQALGTQLTEQNIQEILHEREAEKIMSSELLLSRILMLERAVQQNVYHRQHLDCRDLPDIAPLVLLNDEDRKQNAGGNQGGGVGFGFGAASLGVGVPVSGGSIGDLGSQESKSILSAGDDEDSAPRKVKKLFSFFYAPLIQGRAVTAMVWNSVNTDILAVSYGRTNFKLDVNSHKLGSALDEELAGGLVLFWSLRNPEYPEKILRTKHPVTSLDFSRFSPMLLAVGCYNGDVMIFDVKREGADWGKPKETSTSIGGGHVEPVWQIKWVSKGSDRLENVVSISTDGEVLLWDLKKGLSVQALMSLKRGGLGDGWISRQAAGLTFDFVPGDPSTYFVGTEEGGVHKCSVSYNEQYLETYENHEGPVYRLRCSSRWPSIFLTCSSDWNVKLFHVRNKKPLLTMRTTGDNDAVTDTIWCPSNATVFASVTESGKLHIWDLSVSSIDPIVNYDTTVDIVDENKVAEEKPVENTEEIDPDNLAALTANRREFGKTDANDEPKESPVAKLLRNLSEKEKGAGTKREAKRSLTTVVFSEKSPTIVVGDTDGAVTLYRVIDPVTVLHEGPVQQVQRLKTSILRQSDPEGAAKLLSYEDSSSQSGNDAADHGY